jgi:hypothetical protein
MPSLKNNSSGVFVQGLLSTKTVLPEADQQETVINAPLPAIVHAALASPSNLRSFSLTGLFVLAIFYTLYFAADFVLLVALALLMSLLLLPLVALLSRMKIPEPIG